MDHQDWKPVVFDKPKQIKKPIIHPQTLLQKIEKTDEIIPLKTVDPKMANKLVLARTTKKLTRKQLAQQLSISENFITDFETCKKKPDDKIMNKILNFINKTLTVEK
jgi:ribosome-binding protein aMBF1 (putative translation factor)